MENNERRAVVLPHSLLEALDKYVVENGYSYDHAN